MCANWWVVLISVTIALVVVVVSLLQVYRVNSKYYELQSRVDTVSAIVEGYHEYFAAHSV